jgi:hypothetical protein
VSSIRREPDEGRPRRDPCRPRAEPHPVRR